MKPHSLLTIIIVVAANLSPLTESANAASAAGIGIRLGGEHVSGYTITWDGESDAELWVKLRNIPLTFERDFKIPVDPKDDSKATLRGEIEISARLRGDRSRSPAKTDHLRFVRRGDRWFLAEEDIIRTLKLAGLAAPEDE